MAPRKRARKIKTEGPRRGRQDDVEGMRKSESRSGTEENDEDWKPEKVSIKAVRKRTRKQASGAVVKAGEDNGVGEAAKVVPNVDTKPSPKKRRVTKERLSNQIGTSLVAKLDDAQRMAGQQANPFTKANKVEEQGAGYGMHHFESNDMDMISLSGSEDEWEEMEEVEPPAGPIVEVTIRQPKQEESEESKWAKFIRQEVNRQINKRKVNCHKMHLLCYIAHLRQWMRCLVRSEYLSAQCLSLIPVGYVSAAELTFDVALAERFLKWFKSAFTPAKKFYEARSGFSDAQAERLGRLISEKVYETDKDIASILLLCVFALKQSVRLCLSCQPVPHKPNLHSLVKSIKLNEENETETRLAEIDERRVSNAKKTTLKATKRTKWNSCGNSGHSVDGKCSPENIEHGQRGRKKKKADANSRKETPEPKKKKSTPNIRPERNYWVEYWDEVSERWICIDPLKGTVDMVESIEADATPPMHYVIAVDNDFGMRDVTARYASKYLRPEVRRLRIDEEWWSCSLEPFRSKNRTRERIESVAIHDFLLSKPMPVTIADFKNHPLYVLKKDLLKFEAIYPNDQKPITTLRNGVEVYPRSSVHHLQGSLNWIKQARSIKPGEKPYKVVKARPNIRIPEAEREPRTLDLYGYWQTQPYVPPEVVDERIPRNEYGNIYMYKSCMLPKGCVHLRLDGLYGIARQMDIECVPAVVGWDFHKGGNHPIIDGCVVLSKDAMRLRAAWEEHYEKKKINAVRRRKERAKKNWKRLVRGVLMMKKVHAKFLGPDRRQITTDEQLETGEAVKELKTETPIGDDMALAWPSTKYDLPAAGSRTVKE